MVAALGGLITDGQALMTQFQKDGQTWTNLFVVWLKACESTLEAIYGSSSEALNQFKAIHFLAPPGVVYASSAEQNAGERIWFESGLNYAVVTLAGYRYSIDRLLAPDTPPPRSPQYVFISHGGPVMTHVEGVSQLLTAVGLFPIVVARLPSMNLSLNQKVLQYLSICAAGIALATEDDEAEAAAQHRPRGNVEHEIGLLQAATNINGRIIYCKEPQVKFATNYAEKAWIPFTKEQIEPAFVPILRELRAFQLI